MTLFKDRWKRCQEQEPTRVPLARDEAWAIVSVCLLLVAFMCVVWSVESDRVTAANKAQERGCRCSE
jgi:hypothetical protein